MKYLKQFFKDLVDLSRPEFFQKYLLPPVTLILVWLTIGSLFELTYKKEDLNLITGRIKNIKQVVTKVVNKPLYKGKEQEIHLYLDNYPAFFRLTDNYDYSNLQTRLKIGDTVSIFYRKKYLVSLGFGRQTDIYQLEYKNHVLFDLKQRKKNSKKLIIIGSIASIIFGGLIFFRQRRIKKFSNQNNLKVTSL